MDQIELIEKMRRLEEEKEREIENDGVLEDENEIAKNNENDKENEKEKNNENENEEKEIEDSDLVDLDASEGEHGIDVVIAMNHMNSRVVELENKVAWYKTALDAAVDSASNMMKTYNEDKEKEKERKEMKENKRDKEIGAKTTKNKRRIFYDQHKLDPEIREEAMKMKEESGKKKYMWFCVMTVTNRMFDEIKKNKKEDKEKERSGGLDNNDRASES